MSDPMTPEAALAAALRATGHVGADRPDVVADILANLPEGFALVSVEEVARRLAGASGVDDHAWREWYLRNWYLAEARRLLGIGGER
jgi:hypothetical protein